MMNYCPDCGSKLESNYKICPYCGYDLNQFSTSDTDEKDKKIKALEAKISRLEKQNNVEHNSHWVFIMPIAFVAIFFLFVFMIIFITR